MTTTPQTTETNQTIAITDRVYARVYSANASERVMRSLFTSGMPFAIDYRISRTGETGFSAPIGARANFEAAIALAGAKAGSVDIVKT